MFYVDGDSGTAYEPKAQYTPANVAMGATTVLFTGGTGLSLSPNGRSIEFSRTVPEDDADMPGAWVATLAY